MRHHRPYCGVRVGEAARPGPISALCPLDDPDGSSAFSDEDAEMRSSDAWTSPPDAELDELSETSLGGPIHIPQSLGSMQMNQDAGYTAAKRFKGAVAGWCFKLGELGLGYYLDSNKAAATLSLGANCGPPPAAIWLEYIVGKPVALPALGVAIDRLTISLDDLVPLDGVKADQRYRVAARSKRVRKRHRRGGVVPLRPMNTALGEAKRCADHRDFGFWAFDTLNSNIVSTGQAYLEETSADVVFLQELRTAGDHALTAQRRAKKSKWSLAIEPAKRTDADSLSAGVGVAVRSHMGHSRVPDQVPFECCDSRVMITHLGAVCTGGIFLVSAYFWCNEGASKRNLMVLQCIAQRVLQLHGPWIMAADFNFPPGVLRGTGWLQLVGGCIMATGQATCKGVEDDYFVVDKRLRNSVVGVACIHDTGSKPHTAVRLWLRGNPRRDLVRSLVAPKKADACLPLGCLPEHAARWLDTIVDVNRREDFMWQCWTKVSCSGLGWLSSRLGTCMGGVPERELLSVHAAMARGSW